MIEENIAIFVHDAVISSDESVYEDFALGLTKSNYRIKVLNNNRMHRRFVKYNVSHENEEDVDLSIALDEFCNRNQYIKSDKLIILVINIQQNMSLENFNINSHLRLRAQIVHQNLFITIHTYK